MFLDIFSCGATKKKQMAALRKLQVCQKFTIF